MNNTCYMPSIVRHSSLRDFSLHCCNRIYIAIVENIRWKHNTYPITASYNNLIDLFVHDYEIIIYGLKAYILFF